MKVKVQLGALGASVFICFASCKAPDRPAPPTAPPAITTFTVSADRVNRGQSVQFTFATLRAKGVTLIDQTGADVPTIFDPASGAGTASASPVASSFYVLRADGEGGRDSAFVQVAVNEAPKSVFLVVVPTVVNAGGAVDVLWSAPGATDVTVKAGTRQVGIGASGTAIDTPALSTTYTLSGSWGDEGALSTQVAVKVQPVIERFVVTPAARPGQTLKLEWKTAGAERVVLSEATFGPLLDSSTATGEGSFDFEVPFFFGDGGVPPAGEDGGVSDAGSSFVLPVRTGFPLKFTLVASTATPTQSVARAVNARVGDGPSIDSFTTPVAAAPARSQLLSWETTNATRVELLANGLPLFTPRVGSSLDGSFTLPTIDTETTFTLVAYDFTGLSVSVSRTVKSVKAPVIVSFTLPLMAASPSSSLAAQWQTTDAVSVLVRVKNGPTVYFTDVGATVGTGTTSLATGLSTTFVLEARNLAGDVALAERLVTVTTPTTFSITPNPAIAGATLTASWDVSALSATDLPGLPSATAQAAANGAASFIDLDATPQATALSFGDRNDGQARFEAPAGFTFPFVTTLASAFSVSVNGALVPGGAGAVAATNADLGAATWAGPQLIAPFWDDLDLGADGSVKWFLEGTQFPRVLVIQWSKVQISGRAGSELTFQVQLEETGKYRFSYKALTGPNADGVSASIGAVERPATFQASRAFNAAAAVSTGDELLWFGGDASRATGSQSFKLDRSSTFGFFAASGAGKLTPVFSVVRVFAPNSVSITEAMPVSAESLTEGRWVELFNPGAERIDVSDLELVSSAAATTSYALPAGTTIDAGAYLVVGDTVDQAANGGAPVSHAWGTNVPLAAADQVSLRVPGTTPFTLSTLAWVAGPADAGVVASLPGSSVQPSEGALTATGPLTCARTRSYGTASQIGTPGETNETCFEYRLDRVPVAFEDVSSGTAIFPLLDSNDDEYATITLPLPFKYFGTTATTATVSTNGWVAFGPQTNSAASNRTAPSTMASPVGTLAVFWDDHASSEVAFPNAGVYWARVGDHVTIMWLHSTHYWPVGDDLNFEVKLFDNGVIEYHYGTMTNYSGGTDRYAEGGSATVWLERPDGSAALPIIANESATTAAGFLSPNTAYRFTPKN